MITIQNVKLMFKVSPTTLQTFIDTLNCVLEDHVQYSTVHIPNVFYDGHLQIVSCVGIVRIHWVKCTETFWSPPIIDLPPYFLSVHITYATQHIKVYLIFLLVSVGCMDLCSWNAVKIKNNETLMFQGSNGSPPSPPPAINWGSVNFILPFMPLTSLQKHLRWNWMRNPTIYFRVVGSADECIPNSCCVTSSKNTIITTGKDLFH